MSDAFNLKMPESRTTSVVFASPHSGRDYGRSFLRQTVLDERLIRSSEDAFVDRLLTAAPEHGAILMAARKPRAFVDLNRDCSELDSALIEGVKKQAHNPRVASGLGVIPRVVSGSRAIYRGKISQEEAFERIRGYWRPYHDMLHTILTQNQTLFGRSILVDCHSMPHEALEVLTRANRPRPDIVIGDRFGASADEDIVAQIEQIFSDAGLRVARNTPFAGAYIAKQYGQPVKNRHCIQIEIDRALYMDEQMVLPNDNFGAFQSLMKNVTARIADIGRGEIRLAAE
ncbi:N-formylglutamate amidohydrolase [Halocynthiibacter sp. C4]|uniref:N-formylglutamate amidohydrolase n=1 Tax=Halocynthiibacter sp. C4 TaxID=2992758 RepID=UPI00237A0CE1|nr:N-formylglutamate amidohydrolase [Halocynthiibacter sp. C4]MDE0591134.1 N-formylglutamate amidohydrolase [Halocynthiibacter sp. C4]